MFPIKKSPLLVVGDVMGQIYHNHAKIKDVKIAPTAERSDVKQ